MDQLISVIVPAYSVDYLWHLVCGIYYFGGIYQGQLYDKIVSVSQNYREQFRLRGVLDQESEGGTSRLSFFARTKYSANCDTYLTESQFHTHP